MVSQWKLKSSVMIRCGAKSVPETSFATDSTEPGPGNAVDTGAASAERRSPRRKARPTTVSNIEELLLCWFSVKMTARLDVNATPGVRMSPLAPEIVPECSGASRLKRATRAGFAALDTPSALWYSLLVGERERSGAPGIRVFMRAPCYVRRSRRASRACSSFRSRSDQISGALPAMKSSGAM